jgi:hypothetical protein
MKRYGISLGSVENGVYFREEKERVCLLQKAEREKGQGAPHPLSG